MAWLEIHQSLRDHRKTYEAADALDVKPVTMMGMLISLWLWAIDNVPDGDITEIRPKTIARAAQWDGDPEELMNVLIDCGWFDKHDGQILIHDWQEYAGKLIDRREQEKAYRMRQRTLYSNMRVIKAVRNRDGDNCRYCGRIVNWDDRKGAGGGTYNLVDPDGDHSIDNIVVACRACDLKKAGRTPEQAGMTLLQPRTTATDEQISGKNQVDNQQISTDNQQINGKKNLLLQYSTVQYSTNIDIDSKESKGDKPPEPPADPPADREPVPYKKIQELFISTCLSFPKIININGQRKKAVSARWNEYKSIQAFEELFRKAEASSFLKGHNDRNWKADFDWLMKPTNMAKVLEGKYDDKGGVIGNGGNSKHSEQDARPDRGQAEAPKLTGFRMATDPTRDPK